MTGVLRAREPVRCRSRSDPCAPGRPARRLLRLSGLNLDPARRASDLRTFVVLLRLDGSPHALGFRGRRLIALAAANEQQPNQGQKQKTLDTHTAQTLPLPNMFPPLDLRQSNLMSIGDAGGQE